MYTKTESKNWLKLIQELTALAFTKMNQFLSIQKKYENNLDSDLHRQQESQTQGFGKISYHKRELNPLTLEYNHRVHFYLHWMTSSTGFSIRSLNRLENRATVAPSTTLWSAAQLTHIICASSTAPVLPKRGSFYKQTEHKKINYPSKEADKWKQHIRKAHKGNKWQPFNSHIPGNDPMLQLQLQAQVKQVLCRYLQSANKISFIHLL